MRAAAEFAIVAAVLFSIGVGAALIFQAEPVKDLFQRPPEPASADATATGVPMPGATTPPVHGAVSGHPVGEA